jgi:aerobic-type carbon monoxide dehydrogenase small subunit (CoxS/CutS family)
MAAFRGFIMATRISFKVDGRTRTVHADDPDMPLLYALRNDLGVTGPKFGCGLAQCGACTVIVDSEVTRSCSTAVSDVAGKSVRTIGGLGTAERPHPVQQAFIEEQVPFCGYCLSGWVMTSVAMLEKDPRRSEADIRDGLAGLKCRCGAHMAVLRAVTKAAKAMA